MVATTLKKTSRLAPAECWHLCPRHASLYPLWERMSDADQIEVGVLWKHPVDAIAKIDDYEKLCPECRKKHGKA